MDKITDVLRDKLTETLSAGVTDEAVASLKKKVNDIIYEVETDIEYRLRDDLAPMLSAYVVEMANKTITAILEGNQREMERYLGCERGCWTGRSDSPQFGRKREDHEWHPIIHGKMFEQGAVKLRRDLVNAHKDLITTQRILDLEDQVNSLVAQVNKVNDENTALRERVSGYL